MRLSVAVPGFWILVGCATGTTRSDGTGPYPAASLQSPASPPRAPTSPPPPERRSSPGTAFAEQATGVRRSAHAGPAPLFDRLGGQGAIAAVVDEFLGRVSRDERINARFLNADLPRLRGMLVDLICQASGGSCQYRGKDMRSAHAGMRIVGSEFDALVQNLRGALDHLSVPARERDELLGLLGPMKSDVTQDAPAPAAGPSPTAPAPASTLDPVVERAHAVREAASLLEKANTARLRGSRSFAEQLFSSAELIVGADAVADLAPLFREGAPPRVFGPLKTIARDTPPQPATVGSSDDDYSGPRSKAGSLSGGIVLPAGRPLDGLAVVTLEPASGKFSRRSPKQRVIEQRNREFAPRVLAVPVGSTVSFPNFDAVYHNVFSRSKARPFDLGIYKGGQARELVFDKEGIIRIGCNLHANMSAYVVAVAAPHYAVTDSQGRFSFRSLTPGRYRLRTFLEGSDAPVAQDVEVKAGPHRVVVTIAGEGPAGAQTDKFGVPRGGPIRK